MKRFYIDAYHRVSIMLFKHEYLNDYEIDTALAPLKELVDRFGDVKEIAGYPVGELYTLAHILKDAGIEADQYGKFAKNYILLAKNSNAVAKNIAIVLAAYQAQNINPKDKNQYLAPRDVSEAIKHLWVVASMLFEEQTKGNNEHPAIAEEETPKGHGA